MQADKTKLFQNSFSYRDFGKVRLHLPAVSPHDHGLLQKSIRGRRGSPWWLGNSVSQPLQKSLQEAVCLCISLLLSLQTFWLQTIRPGRFRRSVATP